MIVYHLTLSDHWHVLSGEGIYEEFCPRNFYELHKASLTAGQYYYIYFTKFAATALLYHLNGILRTNHRDELEKFKVNWASYALPTSGLITSRVQNSISYVLVLFTTIFLFFTQSDLTDVVLNYIAMQFIVNFDEELAFYHKVTKGIGSVNDKGKNIYLSYITSGVRKCDDLNKFCDKEIFITLSKLFSFICVCLYMWTFTCV